MTINDLECYRVSHRKAPRNCFERLTAGIVTGENDLTSMPRMCLQRQDILKGSMMNWPRLESATISIDEALRRDT